jgi:hypothetical protein
MNSSLAKAAPLFSFTRPLVYEAFKKKQIYGEDSDIFSCWFGLALSE